MNGIDPQTYAYLKGLQRTDKQIRREHRIETAWRIGGLIAAGMLAGYIVGIGIVAAAW